MKKLLLLSLFMVGCAKQDYIQDVNMFHGVDSELQYWFDQYTHDTGLSTAGVTGGFTKLSSDLAGLCVYNSNSNEVRIDKEYWAYISYNTQRQRQLIYHELTHCVQHLGHIDTMSSDGYYKLSIMNSVSFSDWEVNYMMSRYNDFISAMIHNKPVSYP